MDDTIELLWKCKDTNIFFKITYFIEDNSKNYDIIIKSASASKQMRFQFFVSERTREP